MMNINKIIFLSSTLVSLLFIYGTSSGIISTEAQRFFASIKPEARDDFICHYLMEGLKGRDLRRSKIKSFSDEVAPENFAMNLVAWTMEEFEMTEDEVAFLAQGNEVCFPNGFCYNPSDVGSNCCPF